MSIRIMFRKCEHCRHRYTYNTSTGNFGIVCPKCHKAQTKLVPAPTTILKHYYDQKISRRDNHLSF